MNTAKYFLVSLFMAITSFDARAQANAKEVNTQTQSWISVNSTLRLKNKFGLITDIHVRRNDLLAKEGFYFVRIGANYWIRENLTATAGYAHMWVAPANQSWQHFSREHRMYQQLQLNAKTGKINITQRLRNEQRWQEKIVDDHFINRYKFTNRARYLLSITVPVFKDPQLPKLVLADELAVQSGREIVYNSFDQNRLFAGIRQQITKTLAFDFGYMRVYQQKASGYQYDRNHTLRLFFYYSPDLRHK